MKKLIAALLALAFVSVPAWSQAIWNQNAVLSGDTPQGELLLTCQEGELTFTAIGFPEGQFVTDVLVNIPNGVLLDPVKTGVFDLPEAEWGKAHHGQLEFSLKLEFATSNAGGGVKRFDGNDSVSWTLEHPLIPGIWPEVCNSKDWTWVAHVQGVGSDNEGSAWVGHQVPEPGAYGAMFALGLIGFSFYRRWRR